MSFLRLSLLMCLFILPDLSFGSELDDIRASFSKVLTAAELDEAIAKIKEDTTPLISAYKGALIMRKAEFAFSPFKKLSFFNDGKKLIEKAIAENPNEPEARYVRLLVQSQSPGFLGYKKNIKEDLKFIFANIMACSIEKSYKRQMINTLLELNLFEDGSVEAASLSEFVRQS